MIISLLLLIAAFCPCICLRHRTRIAVFIGLDKNERDQNPAANTMSWMGRKKYWCRHYHGNQRKQVQEANNWRHCLTDSCQYVLYMNLDLLVLQTFSDKWSVSLVPQALLNTLTLHVLSIMPCKYVIDFSLGQNHLRKTCIFFPTRHINIQL